MKVEIAFVPVSVIYLFWEEMSTGFIFHVNSVRRLQNHPRSSAPPLSIVHLVTFVIVACFSFVCLHVVAVDNEVHPITVIVH